MISRADFLIGAALGIFIGALGVSIAKAAGPTVLQPCSTASCDFVEKGEHKYMLLTRGVLAVRQSIVCENCSEIMSTSGESYHVIGHWLDLSCRIWGGDFCLWNREALTPERTIELQ